MNYREHKEQLEAAIRYCELMFRLPKSKPLYLFGPREIVRQYNHLLLIRLVKSFITQALLLFYIYSSILGVGYEMRRQIVRVMTYSNV
jgi:hypothetical protein